MAQEKTISRQQQAEITKQKLFDAALSLLKENDFEKIRIQDIVERAGVSVGAFYVYYKSKLDLFYQTYEFADEYFENEVAAKLVQLTAKEKLQCFFYEYAYYSSQLTDFKLCRLLYNADNKWFNRENDSGMIKVLNKIIEQGMQNGEFKNAQNAKDIAQYMMVCIRGLVYNWCTLNGSYNLMDKTSEYVSLLLCGICND